MRRITKAALGGIAGCALVLGGTGVASGALLKIQSWSEDLTTTPTVPLDEVLDSARAKITINQGTDSTTFTIRVTGIDPSIAGTKLGSHLHIGRCVEGKPTDAGPHYNHQVAVDGKKLPATEVDPTDWAEVSADTEVWFDLVPNEDGMAYDTTTAQFIPVDSDGVMSIVIHQRETDGTGAAGPRQVCFPVNVPQWIPEEPSPSPSPTE